MAGEGWHAQRLRVRPCTCPYDTWCFFHRSDRIARGLMELIIINIGLQRGIISEGLFATLVIMAVVTTLMASPLFDRLVGSGTHQLVPEPEAEESTEPGFVH